MKLEFKSLITEWFANLDKGYAVAPYSTKEMNVLKRILESKKIDPKPYIYALKNNT